MDSEKMIKRLIGRKIGDKLRTGKAIILIGAHQTGKTTLLKAMFEARSDVLWLNADEPDVQSLFENATSSRFKKLFAGYETVVIDEAQRIENIGLKLKLIVDNIPRIQLLATGSSAFELSNSINEPLTGRKWEYRLFPLSFEEMAIHHGILEEKRMLPHRLVYGYYPDVVKNAGNEKELLKQLSDSFLYKDILMWERIQKPEKLLKLLQALAFQLGNEVSYNELGRLTGLDGKTVEKYIQLLEQTFVIFCLRAFSRNLRSELKRGRKVYFYDNGIRNALIASFGEVNLRMDIGALWENFLISERMKNLHYHQIWANAYFWRTTNQQEIDYLEERDGKLYAFEFKWSVSKKVRFPKTFLNAYPNNESLLVTPDNFMDFLSLI